MHLLKKFLGLCFSVLLVTVLAGCVAPLPNSDFAYYPKARPGITIVEAAKNDLALMGKDINIRVERDEKQKPYRFSDEGELNKLMEEYERKGGKSSVSYGPDPSARMFSRSMRCVSLHFPYRTTE